MRAGRAKTVKKPMKLVFSAFMEVLEDILEMSLVGMVARRRRALTLKNKVPTNTRFKRNQIQKPWG
jgi:hypothetical protein